MCYFAYLAPLLKPQNERGGKKASDQSPQPTHNKQPITERFVAAVSQSEPSMSDFLRRNRGSIQLAERHFINE